MDKSNYRHPADLTDSEEEIHPNIDIKSYRIFIKEERIKRFNDLRSKDKLSEEEAKELKKLEYKFLPVAVEVPENSFRTSKEDSEPDDYARDLATILNNNNIQFFIEYLDSKIINLEKFEELIYFNLSESIKEGDEVFGLELCKVGLMVKWARDFGRPYLLKISSGEDKLNEVVKNHYEISKEAILSLSD